jgi:hypothetical protein
MTDQQDEQLERALTELTSWHGPVPQLWRRALKGAKAGRPRTSPRLAWLLHQRLSAPVAAAIIVVALGATIAINLPHLAGRQQARRPTATSPQSGESALSIGRHFTGRYEAVAPEDAGEPEFLGGAYVVPEARLQETAQNREWFPAAVGGMGGYAPPGELTLQLAPGEDLGQERQIIRKATIELLTDDVRAAFLKAMRIVSEAKGEFVQDSSLSGIAESMQADLTLRVAADRLPEVMNELRQLGEVRSEKLVGEDVTTQIVDLEARLRNEQRVEAELLDLLEKRQDAPLKEILDLRSSLSQVRSAIERLTAQRERLNRLVSLATALVIIRTKDAPEPETPSIGSYFIDGIQRAWQKGLMLLSDTCGVLLSVLVGGLIWWVLIAVVFTAILRYRRRRLAATGSTSKS